MSHTSITLFTKLFGVTFCFFLPCFPVSRFSAAPLRLRRSSSAFSVPSLPRRPHPFSVSSLCCHFSTNIPRFSPVFRRFSFDPLVHHPYSSSFFFSPSPFTITTEEPSKRPQSSGGEAGRIYASEGLKTFCASRAWLQYLPSASAAAGRVGSHTLTMFLLDKHFFVVPGWQIPETHGGRRRC